MLFARCAYNERMNTIGSENSVRLPQQVRIVAPARLHLGFVGLNSSKSLRYGALGLAIDRPCFDIEASICSSPTPMSDRVYRYVKAVKQYLNTNDNIEISIREEILSHAGLGSGTQLALGVAFAIFALYEISVAPEKASTLLGRGKRSGIGTEAFHSGGFLVDQDPVDQGCRPIAIRMPYPGNWRIVLIYDGRKQGVHGEREVAAFESLQGFPEELSSRLHQLLEYKVLPALKAGNILSFGKGITSIQKQVGDYFSAVQGGRYSSELVASALEFALRNGAAGIGQSSWGPTGFVITDSDKSASDLVRMLRSRNTGDTLAFQICKPRNKGATISAESIEATCRVRKSA